MKYTLIFQPNQNVEEYESVVVSDPHNILHVATASFTAVGIVASLEYIWSGDTAAWWLEDGVPNAGWNTDAVPAEYFCIYLHVVPAPTPTS